MGLFKRLFGGSPESEPRPAQAAADSMSRIPMEELGRIQAVALSGRKIEAVKLYRQASGCGLKEAKEAVEQIVAGPR